MNGGNSTKSTGIDKRKNAYRNAVLHKFKELFIVNEDIQAGKTILEYCVVKPTTEIDLKNNGVTLIPTVTITQKEADRINTELDGEC